MKNEEIVTSTWREVGFRARPLRDQIFVRTELRPEMENGVYIPQSQRTNFAGLAHQVLLWSVVVAAGPGCKSISVGDRVAFTRLFFAWTHRLEDGTLLGYIREPNLSVIDETPPNEPK